MKKEYWNDIASKGAVLGVIMMASHILEQTCIMHSSLGGLALIGVETIAVIVLYIYLLYRFAKGAAAKFGDNVLGFPYGQALLYTIYVSVFAGIIVGFGGYIYLHYIVGYEHYIEQMIDNMQQILYASGTSSLAMRRYDDMLAALAEQAEPGVISTIISSVCSYAFWGLIIGLFIAGGVKREPQIFDNNGQNEE